MPKTSDENAEFSFCISKIFLLTGVEEIRRNIYPCIHGLQSYIPRPQQQQNLGQTIIGGNQQLNRLQVPIQLRGQQHVQIRQPQIKPQNHQFRVLINPKVKQQHPLPLPIIPPKQQVQQTVQVPVQHARGQQPRQIPVQQPQRLGPRCASPMPPKIVQVNVPSRQPLQQQVQPLSNVHQQLVQQMHQTFHGQVPNLPGVNICLYLLHC